MHEEMHTHTPAENVKELATLDNMHINIHKDTYTHTCKGNVKELAALDNMHINILQAHTYI